MTAKVFLWKKKRKSDNKLHVKIYMGDKNKNKFYPLNIWVNKNDWVGARLKESAYNSAVLNGEISDAIYKFESLIRQNPAASIDEIIALYENKKEKNNFFYFVESFIKQATLLRAPATIKTYWTAYNMLKVFDRN